MEFGILKHTRIRQKSRLRVFNSIFTFFTSRTVSNSGEMRNKRQHSKKIRSEHSNVFFSARSGCDRALKFIEQKKNPRN